jgi:hypothetical protein
MYVYIFLYDIFLGYMYFYIFLRYIYFYIILWYISRIHVFLKYDVSDSGFCLRIHVEPTQVDPIKTLQNWGGVMGMEKKEKRRKGPKLSGKGGERRRGAAPRAEFMAVHNIRLFLSLAKRDLFLPPHSSCSNKFPSRFSESGGILWISKKLVLRD